MKITTHVFDRQSYLLGYRRLMLLALGVFFNLLWLGEHSVNAQNIPDANFAQAIREQCPTCIDGGNNLLAPAKTLTDLDLSSKNIASIEGIVGFSKLRVLYCPFNKLTEVPVLPASVTVFYLSSNNLTSLPMLPANTVSIDVGNNKLTSLPTLPASLTGLSVYNNNISSIPALPAGLLSLDCDNNLLGSLPQLPAGLLSLVCGYNSFGSLPQLPASLQSLGCRGLGLTDLPILPVNLLSLVCDDNNLTSLPTLPEGLTLLRCFNNNLTSLPTLPHSLQDLLIDAEKITCLPNAVNFLRVYNDHNRIHNPPLCFTTPTASANCLALGDQCSGNASEVKAYNLVQAAAGSQALKLTYRASEGESWLQLTINGTSHSITLPQTAGGGAYQTVVLGIYALNAGNNAITLATGGGYLCFRQLCTEGGTTTPDPTSTPASCLALGDQCSGNSFETKSYTFNAAATGDQELMLTYSALEGPSTLRLIVNGRFTTVALPQTPRNQPYQTINLGYFYLTGGNNSIVMASEDSYMCFRELCVSGTTTPTPPPPPVPEPNSCLALGDQCSGNLSEVKSYTLNATAGRYYLALKYRALEGQSILRLTINGTIQNIGLAQTPADLSYETVYLNDFPLNSGSNTITMSSYGGYVCLRELCATGVSAPPAPNSCLALGDQCSSNTLDTKSFTLNVASATRKMLRLTYRAHEQITTLRLIINGSLINVLLPQTPGDLSYRTVNIGSYGLVAGNNSIMMTTGDGYVCFRELCTSDDNSTARLSAETETALEAKALTTYPNPTTGTFEASFYLAPGQRAALSVNDILGRPIWTKALTGQGEHKEQIRLSEAASGMFILRLQRENAEPGKAAEFMKVLVVK